MPVRPTTALPTSPSSRRTIATTTATATRAITTASVLLVLLLVATACSSPGTDADADGAEAGDPASGQTEGAGEEDGDAATGAADIQVEVLLDGLDGPTQIAFHPDGRLLVAEIGEGEGTPTGTVTAIDLQDPDDREVLLDGLNTPTGVTAADGRLWVMEPDRMLVAPLAGGATEVVFEDMPNNGRSNGTILTAADGTLLFDTAGRRSGFDAGEDSGILWRLDPTTIPDDPPADGYGTRILEGMKHAYAVAERGDELVVNEMSDGRYDGERAPDELIVVPASPQGGAVPTGGWPRCIGDRIPVAEFEGDVELCEATVPSVAVFDAGATPTGVAIAPWDPDAAVVALWSSSELVQVPLGGDGLAAPEVLSTAVAQPQHLLVDGDRLLLTGFSDGQILSVTRG